MVKNVGVKNESAKVAGEKPDRSPLSILVGSSRSAKEPRVKESRKDEWGLERKVYWSHKRPVELYSFDEDYLRRLGAHDPATEAHFVSYFSERLKVALRARGIDSHTIEDVRQETFCRVWVAVRAGSVN